MAEDEEYQVSFKRRFHALVGERTVSSSEPGNLQDPIRTGRQVDLFDLSPAFLEGAPTHGLRSPTRNALPAQRARRERPPSAGTRPAQPERQSH